MGTNLTDEQRAQEADWLRLLLKSPVELADLIEQLGPERAQAALEREVGRLGKKR